MIFWGARNIKSTRAPTVNCVVSKILTYIAYLLWIWKPGISFEYYLRYVNVMRHISTNVFFAMINEPLRKGKIIYYCI